MATTAEIIAQLRQQFAGGIGTGGRADVDQNGASTGFYDFNVGDQRLRLQRQRTGNINDNDGSSPGGYGQGNYIGSLNGLQVNPETGKPGGYLGTFDHRDGSLQDVQWKDQPNKNNGLAGFMANYGPLLVGAAAGAGYFMGGGAGAGAAGAAAGGGAPISASPISALGPAATWGDIAAAAGQGSLGMAGRAALGQLGGGAVGGAGSLLSPGSAVAIGGLLGGGLSSPSAPPAPVDDSAAREAELNANIGRINGLFGNRDGLYGQIRDDAYSLQSSRLNESREDTLRKLRFGAARTGLTTGSADISAKGREQRSFGRALQDASTAAQGQADTARANDERTRLSLISQMRAGLGTADATQSALAQMQDNLSTARSDQRFNAADNYAGAVMPIVNQYQVQQGQQQARQAWQQPYRSPGSYTGTISR